MMLTWEAISALGTALSAIVVAATVLLSMRQIRIAAEQLMQLRRSTQLAGTMEMVDRLSSSDMRDALRFVGQQLAERMKDEDFSAGVRLVGLADPAIHRELAVLRGYEELGTYIKHGLLDGEVFYDLMAPPILNCWSTLVTLEIIGMHRAVNGTGMWENFELLYMKTKAFVTAHGPHHIIAVESEEIAQRDGLPVENDSGRI